MTRRTADEVINKKIEGEIQKLPRQEGEMQQDILDEIQRQAVKQDMRCLMVYNIDMSLRKKHPRMILDKFADLCLRQEMSLNVEPWPHVD